MHSGKQLRIFSTTCCLREYLAPWCLNRPNAFRRRAQIAGLELRELNALEREFLRLLDFRLSVRRDEYDAYAAALAAVRISDAGSAPPTHPGPRTPTDIGADPATPIAPAQPDDDVPVARECSRDAAVKARGAESHCAGARGCGGGGCRCLREPPVEPDPARPPAGPAQQEDD